MKTLQDIKRRKKLLIDTIKDLQKEWVSVDEISKDLWCSRQNVHYILKWNITYKTAEKYLKIIWI